MWFLVAALGLALCGAGAERVQLRGGTWLEGEIVRDDAIGIELKLESGDVVFIAAEDLASKPSGEPEEKLTFIRFQKGEEADALQTAWTIYRDPTSGRRVALAGAVHIADEGYFKELQARLDRYDRVLFEGVGRSPDPEAQAKAQKRLGFIGQLQLEMGDLLDLTFQHDGIDYARENFHNADLGWDELQGELTRRGQTLVPMEGLLRLVSPLLKWSLQAQNKIWEKSGKKEKNANDFKRRLAGVLANADAYLASMGIHDASSRDDVIISARNDAALRELDASFEEEGIRDVVIFYGAAHLPDFHDRLLERGYRVVAWSWLDAWFLPK
ncbi:MAG: hypothetical protein RL885_11100 [Planctomycetota bacterium]